MAKKQTIEKIQKEFIKTLVDLQKTTLETMKREPSIPNFMKDNFLSGGGLAGTREAKRRKKPTKKQLVALSGGRQVLAKKNRLLKPKSQK